MKLNNTAILLLTSLFLLGCEKSFSEQFYKDRHCAEIKYECLNESQNKMAQDNNMFKPMLLNKEQWDDIRRRETLQVYGEVAKMLEIYYPGFWGDKDEAFKLQWIENVDNIATKYYRKHERGTLETMASVCAIIGSDFESNPKLDFIVQKLKTSHVDSPLNEIHNYLRFEILKKDFDEAGRQYNTWSLRWVQEGMPPFTRKVPDFYTEWKEDNETENVWSIYKKTVRTGNDL
ncbi:hypothetical protein D3M79_03720 [Rodentibacter pneumotropicus]|uniref:Lipoprotein n=1 Tax=Rodentibacter pneumotropicus TaxID=758 RepID=A0A4S2PBW5_9PAST|nr:hypothetical protein [Rodentibacter pneumotropicus]THA00692.1 hypothetical protein D3M79_03720 [Rodentibacter pneumotropicus]THA01863.1 hypothetical protein D3M74_04830 [Rodentibacter pneumotropicus]THA05268.1 hypothetical protein D3M77_09850 [Rodentibacter pneumotropicus]THA17155.1 hypothetical protein D3M76_02105 [Rodentibacter pneumotropicus]